MRHVGILAHSPDGAALSFNEFCHEGQRRNGEPIHPNITLDYIAMGHALPLWDKGDYTAVREILSKSINHLAKAGAEFFFCPDNTAHIALEASGPAFQIPGLNIADIVARKAQERGMQKVCILGTRFTMNGPVYPRALGAVGIDCAIPDENQRAAVDRIIFDELVIGQLQPQSREIYCNIISDMKSRGCDGIALVCTEIPLLITQRDSELPILDSTRILAKKAFDVAIGEEPFPDWRGGPV